MSGQRAKLWVIALAASLVLACANPRAFASEQDRDAAGAKLNPAPVTPAELFKPTPGFEAKEAQARNISEELEAEVAARQVPLPAEMALDLEWYSPHVKADEFGKISKGWVKDDLVLLETDKNYLIAIRRADGVERWRCQLSEPIRYEPSVSRNNVVVNSNNYLVAIERNYGAIRWRLLPRFVMSSAPLVIDPAIYPKAYTRDWVALETIYVGGWDGRFYCLQIHGRLSYYVKHILASEDFSAPEFDIFYPWHKTHTSRGIVTTPIEARDNLLYYAADDRQCYAVTNEGEAREPYCLLGAPTTSIAVTASTLSNVTNSLLSSFYVGADDNCLYCLDRLTMKKKWTFPLGVTPVGSIMADNPDTPLVYFTTADGKVRALKLTRASQQTNTGNEIPESAQPLWETPGGGAITASPDVVYIGLNSANSFPGYQGLAAIDKTTGKVLWKTAPGGFFTSYLEFHNDWKDPAREARVYALTTDNRLVSLKEKLRDTGLRVVKAAPVEPEAPKAPVKKAPAAAGEKAADKAGEAAKGANKDAKTE